jgi:DNA (cytosine-5)-methyltransferase 1
VNYIDLFHGIGGFALGAVWAGMKFENHFCSDIEPYCQRLYALRFPDSIQLGDITKIDTEKLKREYPGEWLLSGGFPCQDISIAGKGAGITGTRSGLWFEYWRLIRDLRPRFAIMENVGMLVHRGLREVLGSLAEINYNGCGTVIQAWELGSPTRRPRIYIIANSDCKRWDLWCDNWEKRLIQENQERIAQENKQKWNGWEYRVGEVFQIDDWQKLESKICGVDDGLSSRVDRLKGLGNAIVPQIAELLFRQIKPYIKGE